MENSNQHTTQKYICFTKMQFITYYRHIPAYAITLDIPQQELAIIKYSLETGDILDSKGLKLSNDEMEQILPLCNALEFDKYRNINPDMSSPGFMSYLDDGATRKFIGITDSYIPLMEISMNYSFNIKHQWPTEKIYNFLVQHYVTGKKRFRGWAL